MLYKKRNVNSGGVNIKSTQPTRFCNRGRILLNGGQVRIVAGCIVENYGEMVFKGSCFVSENSSLLIREKLVIGEQVRIGFESVLMDSDDHYLVDMNDMTVSSMTSPIIIGDWNWFGCRTYVKKGTITPPYIIVASPCALLCRDYSLLKRGTIVAGIPGKPIKETDKRIIFDDVNEQVIRNYFKGIRTKDRVSISLFTNDIEKFCKNTINYL